MLHENVLCTEHHGLLMHVQENMHISGSHKYPGIKFEALKASMPFTVINLWF